MSDLSDANTPVFTQCLSAVKKAAGKFPDIRKGKNATQTIPDAVMSAFAVFFFQSPSWLASQRAMQDNTGKNNAQTIFGIGHVPSDNRVRSLLDPASPDLLHDAYWELLGILENADALKQFQVLGDHTLVALDGTVFYSSEKISCSSCLVVHHKDGRTVFSHKAVTPTILSPNVRQAVPLHPEFVAPQDGAIKQDCEINASKRWIESTTDWLREKKAVLLGDDLYAHVPFCRKLSLHSLHFIFTCLRESHQATYEWIDLLEPCDFQSVSELRRDPDGRKRTWTVRFTKGVPLTGEADTLCENWIELRVTDAKGQQTYYNCWITDLDVNAQNAVELARCGRSRWVIENGNNNVLKTKGYHLEHNFGHGEEHLANLLASFNILAFLMHTVLELVGPYQVIIRERLGSRREYFLHLHVLSVYHLFQSWEDLEHFILKAHELGPYAPASPPELTTKGLLRRYPKRKSK